jgi:uncharacterized protein (DUF2252 family)
MDKYPEHDQRGPRLARLRRLKMAQSAHAYVRGNTSKFYEWLKGRRTDNIPDGPSVWICGDCHIGNLGPVADINGKVAIQIRDLDQTVIGNPVHDLLRLALSLAMAARSSDLPGTTTALIMEVAIKCYCEGLLGRNSKVAPARIAPVQQVIRSSLSRKWRHLAEERIDDIEPTIPIGQKFWPLSKQERIQLKELLENKAEYEIVWSLNRGKSDSSIKVLDAAYWVKGCSSLGRLRYAVLVRVGPKRKTRHRLIDVKEAGPSVAPVARGVKMPSSNAERVVVGARCLSPNLGDRMAAGALEGRQVVIRELRPQDLKFEFDGLSQADAILTAGLLASVVGKAHGRQMKPAERASWTKELKRAHTKTLEAPSWLWNAVVTLIGSHEEAYLQHCRAFALETEKGIISELFH